MRLLLKDSKSKQALVTQLRINALVQEGMRPKDTVSYTHLDVYKRQYKYRR